MPMLTNNDVVTRSVAEFLLEVEAVCRRHGLVLSHDAGHGRFEVERFAEPAMNYVLAAGVGESLAGAVMMGG